MYKINAERPVAARKPLHHIGIFLLLGHAAHQRTKTSQPDAKNTLRSILPVVEYNICPGERARGGARWLEAHKERTLRQRHGLALPAASKYVWHIILMVGNNRRACI